MTTIQNKAKYLWVSMKLIKSRTDGWQENASDQIAFG